MVKRHKLLQTLVKNFKKNGGIFMDLLCCESSLFHFFSNSRIVLEFLTYLFQQFLLRVFFSLSINFFTFKQMKIYKELERMLKVSEIKMSVGKVLALAKTITTIQIKLPLNKEVYTQTMLMARHQKIAKLFDEDFWGTQ